MKDRFDRRISLLNGSYGQPLWGQATSEVMDTLESVWLWCDDHDAPFTADAAHLVDLIIKRRNELCAEEMGE